MKLEEKLAALRKRQGLTQLELANTLRVSRQAISKWEVGTALPSTDNLIRLSQLYGVSVEVLVNDSLGLEENAEPATPCKEPAESVPIPKKRFPPIKKSAAALILVIVFALGVLVGMKLLSNPSAEEDIPYIDGLESEIIDISSMEHFSMLP